MKLALIGTGNGNSLHRALAIASMLAIGGFVDAAPRNEPPKLEAVAVIEEIKERNRQLANKKKLFKKRRWSASMKKQKVNR